MLTYPGPKKLTNEFITTVYSKFHLTTPCFAETIFPVNDILRIFDDALKVLKKQYQSCVIDHFVPPTGHTVLCGDIHGNLFSLLHIFDINGLPSETNTYIFMGDLVDRGPNSIEVLSLLFLFKIANPEAIHILRGNHETEERMSVDGLGVDLAERLGEVVPEQMAELFRCLPVACVLRGSQPLCPEHQNAPFLVTESNCWRDWHRVQGKAILALHGGLFRNPVTCPPTSTLVGPDGTPTAAGLAAAIADPMSLNNHPLEIGHLDQLRRLDKKQWRGPIVPESMVDDLLWSDPQLEPGLRFNSIRKGGLLYGPDQTRAFLRGSAEELGLIIRSHEGPDARQPSEREEIGILPMASIDLGISVDHADPETRIPMLLTIFSSPRYPYYRPFSNKGTVLRFANDLCYRVVTYSGGCAASLQSPPTSLLHTPPPRRVPRSTTQSGSAPSPGGCATTCRSCPTTPLRSQSPTPGAAAAAAATTPTKKKHQHHKRRSTSPCPTPGAEAAAPASAGGNLSPLASLLVAKARAASPVPPGAIPPTPSGKPAGSPPVSPATTTTSSTSSTAAPAVPLLPSTSGLTLSSSSTSGTAVPPSPCCGDSAPPSPAILPVTARRSPYLSRHLQETVTPIPLVASLPLMVAGLPDPANRAAALVLDPAAASMLSGSPSTGFLPPPGAAAPAPGPVSSPPLCSPVASPLGSPPPLGLLGAPLDLPLAQPGEETLVYSPPFAEALSSLNSLTNSMLFFSTSGTTTNTSAAAPPAGTIPEEPTCCPAVTTAAPPPPPPAPPSSSGSSDVGSLSSSSSAGNNSPILGARQTRSLSWTLSARPAPLSGIPEGLPPLTPPPPALVALAPGAAPPLTPSPLGQQSSTTQDPAPPAPPPAASPTVGRPATRVDSAATTSGTSTTSRSSDDDMDDEIEFLADRQPAAPPRIYPARRTPNPVGPPCSPQATPLHNQPAPLCTTPLSIRPPLGASSGAAPRPSPLGRRSPVVPIPLRAGQAASWGEDTTATAGIPPAPSPPASSPGGGALPPAPESPSALAAWRKSLSPIAIPIAASPSASGGPAPASPGGLHPAPPGSPMLGTLVANRGSPMWNLGPAGESVCYFSRAVCQVKTQSDSPAENPRLGSTFVHASRSAALLSSSSSSGGGASPLLGGRPPSGRVILPALDRAAEPLLLPTLEPAGPAAPAEDGALRKVQSVIDMPQPAGGYNPFAGAQAATNRIAAPRHHAGPGGANPLAARFSDAAPLGMGMGMGMPLGLALPRGSPPPPPCRRHSESSLTPPAHLRPLVLAPLVGPTEPLSPLQQPPPSCELFQPDETASPPPETEPPTPPAPTLLSRLLASPPSPVLAVAPGPPSPSSSSYSDPDGPSPPGAAPATPPSARSPVRHITSKLRYQWRPPEGPAAEAEAGPLGSEARRAADEPGSLTGQFGIPPDESPGDELWRMVPE
ncbi:putative Serine/threonine-protein phosphatase 7 [Paratrimastix pyriformis]|uniref:Serine/threonine-protein phosphatase n=1 Tax=Paratrimastix pyriformis TaxID=342808 RepID=A0ABQ8UV96_9EUKA|nr:putative Serine/threonine-protein phosphatase 7 [Paratrimastix pyriformis]